MVYCFHSPITTASPTVSLERPFSARSARPDMPSEREKWEERGGEGKG